MKRDEITEELFRSAEMAALARWENEGGSSTDCLLETIPNPSDERADHGEVLSIGTRPISKQASTARELP